MVRPSGHESGNAARGARNQDILGSRMRPFAQALTDDVALAAVAAYIATKK